MVTPEDEIIRKRQRERARVTALLLGGLRRPAVFHHHRQDGNQLVNSAVAQNRNGRTLLILLLIIARWSSSSRHRRRFTAPFARRPASTARPSGPTEAPGAVAGQCQAFSFDANVHPGLPWRFEPEQTDVNVAPGAQTKIFYRAQNLSARAIDRPGGLQRLSRYGRQIFQEDPVLLLHRADASGRARRWTCRWSSSSIPAIKKDPDTKDVHEITLSYTFYPVETVRPRR